MKKLYITFGLFLSSMIFGQSGWNFINPMPGYDLNNAKFINQNTIIATGYFGVLIKTIDGGETWENKNKTIDGSFYEINFFSDKTGYVTCDDTNNTLLKTTDAGETWFTVGQFTRNTIGLFGFNENEIIVYGDLTGVYYYTNNGGTTWQTVTLPIPEQITSLVFFNNNDGVLALHNGQFGTTSDGGNTWIFNSITTQGNIKLYKCNENTVYAIDHDTFLKSTDKGNNWAIFNKPTTTNLIMGGYFIDSNHFYILTSKSIYYTTNGGQSYTVKELINTNYFLSNITFYNNTYGFACGYSNMCFTTDGGESWTVNSNNKIDGVLASADFVDKDNGWLTDQNNNLLITKDGGNTWVTKSFGLGVNIYGVEYFSKDSGWVRCSLGYLKTFDGGTTWFQSQGVEGMSHLVKLQNTSVGYGCGGHYFAKSTDNGFTWSNRYLFDDVYCVSMSVVNEDVIYINSRGGAYPNNYNIIIKSTDKGENWVKLPKVFINQITQIYFINEQIGFAGGVGQELYRTTDGGLTWQVTYYPKQLAINKFYFYDTNNGYAACNNGYLLHTTNGGLNWYKQLIYSGGDVLDMSFINPNTGFAIVYPNCLLKTTDGGITKIENNDTAFNTIKNVDYLLSQNYPNPFNPSTNINFTLPNQAFVTLKIYDILGKEVTILINEELNAGNYTKTWDAKNLSSGVYFYKLTAGKFTETKKMVLVR